MATQQRYRAVVCDAAGNTYGETSYATIDSPTDELNGTGSLTVNVPIDDPQISIFQPITREIAIYRDGLSAPIWRGPIMRPSASSQSPGTVGFQCQNPLWYLQHRNFGSPIFPTNYLVNGSLEVWSGGLPVDWLNSDAAHMTVTQVTKQSNPGQVALGNAAALLTCGTSNVDTFLHQLVTVYPANTEGLDFTLSGWFYIVPTLVSAGAIGARGLFIQFVSGSTVEEAYAVFPIDPASTPQGLWLPATITLEMPAAGTTASPQWAVDCRAYCPVGMIIWDALQLTIPESLSPQEPGGSDQSVIIENIVRMAQGQTAVGGVGFPTDPTKSNLHIGTNCPNTGFLRADLVYQYSDRRGVLDALNDFPTFVPEQDFAVVDISPTVRQFTTYGRAVTDGITVGGTNAFGSASAAFTEDDLYQPLTHQNISGGALIVAINSPTQVTFNGPPAFASGSGLNVFIGGRRGKWKPNTPLLWDGKGGNIATVNPRDIDGDQSANSIVATGDTSGSGAYVGAALNGVELGTLTSPLNLGSTYTALPVTATAAPVVVGDLIRVGVVVWQPGVGQEGEVVIASASVAAGVTSIPIVSHTFGSTWPSGEPVTDFTPAVTMEDVVSAISPTPVGSLASFAYNEMVARRGQTEILTVTTVNDFIDNWCGGVPLTVGDVVPVTVQWGGWLNIVAVPYRINSWSIDPDTDSYTLQLNVVLT